MLKLQSCQNYACHIISGAKTYDHISPLLKELNWLPEKLIYLLEVSVWHLNVWQAQHQIILRLNLLNDLTSMGEKLETHNRYKFPYLNWRIVREASITEQWRYGTHWTMIKTKQRCFKLQMKGRKEASLLGIELYKRCFLYNFYVWSYIVINF